MKKRRGFTLIELLLGFLLFSLIGAGLYSTFQTGLMAYRRSEEGLAFYHEMRLFWNRFLRDVSNMFDYALVPVTADRDELEFATRLKRYSAEGATEDLYRVRYHFRDGRLYREMENLREGEQKTSVKPEEVLGRVRDAEFSYAFYDEENHTLTWQRDWPSRPYFGVPKGIRVVLTLAESDKPNAQKYLYERRIWIPQGRWGSEDVPA